MYKDSMRERVEKAVREAGKLFDYESLDENQVFKKGFGNFVTHIDYKVQDFLVKELDKIIPGSNVITEESDKNRFDFEKPTWILDPVDGTTNLLYRNKLSAISLALFIDGKPVLGVIHNPHYDEMFIGEAGKGAFLNDRKIQVTGNSNLSDSLVAFGTAPYNRDMGRKTFGIVEKVFMQCRDVRRTGSAALDLAYVACGRLDCYFEMILQPWDYAAGLIIVEEAGGKTTNWEGKELNVLSADSVLATNGLIHEQVLKMLV